MQLWKLKNLTFKKKLKPTEILKKEADLFHGGYLIQYDRKQIFDVSYPYLKTNLITYIRNQRIPKSSMEILFQPFDETTWIVLLVIFISGSVSLSILQGNSIISGMMIVFSIIIGGGHSKITFFRRRTRQYLSVLFLCGLVISSIYHAVVFDLMKSDLIKPLPKTLKEILNQNFSNKFVSDRIKSIDILREIPEIQNVSNMFDFKLSRNALYDVLNSETALLGIDSLLFLTYSLIRNNSIDKAFILPEKYSTLYRSFHFTKKSFLVPVFDKTILYMYDFGFFVNCLKSSKKVRKSVENVDRSLTLQNVFGVFKVCSVLLFISTIIFVIEVCYTHIF